MNRVAVLFDPDIDQEEIEAALNAAGLMLRARGSELLVDRVPRLVAKNPHNPERK